jgi:hypothetical protein
MLLKSVRASKDDVLSSKQLYAGSSPVGQSTIREFKSLKEAQAYLDWEYSLPFYKLAKVPVSFLKLVVDNTAKN